MSISRGLHREGWIRVEYDGTIPDGLDEYLRAVDGVRVGSMRPLTLFTDQPEGLLNRLLRYLADRRMSVRRVQVRGSRVA
jgi:hypothetical protein